MAARLDYAYFQPRNLSMELAQSLFKIYMQLPEFKPWNQFGDAVDIFNWLDLLDLLDLPGTCDLNDMGQPDIKFDDAYKRLIAQDLKSCFRFSLTSLRMLRNEFATIKRLMIVRATIFNFLERTNTRPFLEVPQQHFAGIKPQR